MQPLTFQFTQKPKKTAMLNELNKAATNSISKPEDNQIPAQLQRAFTAFFKQPATMMEVSVATGIYRANLCRYVATMRKAGTVAHLGWRVCKVTRHRAGVYTTDPTLFPPQSQLTLWEGLSNGSH